VRDSVEYGRKNYKKEKTVIAIISVLLVVVALAAGCGEKSPLRSLSIFWVM